MTDELRRSEARVASVWPAFDERWIVHEDEDLLAVNKPEGVSCQAAEPEHPDDLVHRLKLHRPGAYLGIHQRLDQDTSGILVYAKRKEANRGLARQLEGRTVDKRYLALVRGWAGGARRLEHRLARGRDGLTHVASRGDRRAKRAVTHVKPLRDGDGGTLLELRIETGRTHQIRAQLAHEGAPVIGDRAYGGPPASRMMLHASSIGLTHPTSGAPLTLEAPAPAAFERRLAGEPEPLRDRLERAIARRWGLAHREDIQALRLVHRGGDAIDWLAADLYGSHVVLHVYDDDAEVEEAIAFFADRFEGVYVKRRPRQANVIVDGRDEGYAPNEPVAGAPAPGEAFVREGELRLLVRLGEGLSTGLFLDQRHNRRWVLENAAGARVLNLFCYTAPFTVAAARGGARETVSVDASARLLDWARHNLALAGHDDARHRLEQADCFEALDAMASRSERFDLVIVDPPTYSRTKTSRWKSGKQWRGLAAGCLRILAPGGRLLASSNDQRMSQGRFRKHLHQAARDAKVKLAQLKDLAPPRDFPPGLDGPHLKALLATTRG